jgi:hypothetical protein
MFHSSATRLRAWLRWTEDILGDPPDGAQRDEYDVHRHPHRRPLRWQRDRRPGAVAAPAAHCISPVRQRAEAERREPAGR